jgi:hypothetical protein
VEQQGREAKKEKQTKADPFGTARPLEVVLTKKGVDWRDHELDAATRSQRHAAATAAHVAIAEAAAKNRARTVPAHACARRSTPAHRAPCDLGLGQTPGLRRCNAEATPRVKDAPPVSRSMWGDRKRKCVGGVQVPVTARRIRWWANRRAGSSASSTSMMDAVPPSEAQLRRAATRAEQNRGEGVLGTELSFSSRGRMTLGVGAIF